MTILSVMMQPWRKSFNLHDLASSLPSVYSIILPGVYSIMGIDDNFLLQRGEGPWRSVDDDSGSRTASVLNYAEVQTKSEHFPHHILHCQAISKQILVFQEKSFWLPGGTKQFAEAELTYLRLCSVVFTSVRCRVSARWRSMRFCPTKISLGPHSMSPRCPKTLPYLKVNAITNIYNMKGLRFGFVDPISRVVGGPRGPRWQFSGWNPGARSQEMLMNLICNMCLEITHLKLLPHLPGQWG